MTKIPVVIDADPGIDDFFAFMVAKASNCLDIKAITAVEGNIEQSITSRNALDIASLLNIDARVARGATNPLISPLRTAGAIHGDNGLGGAVLPKSDKDFDDKWAWDVIYEEAVKAQGKLRIIAIGPLTNVAIALMKYPDLKDMLSGITIMGGSAGWGNISPYAEFNIFVDPHAAAIVFKSGVMIDMVGLNATMQCVFTAEEYKEIFAGCTLEKQLEKMFTHLSDACKKFGLPGASMHDALAIACVFAPEVLEFKRSYVAVEYTSPLAMGQTVITSNNFNRFANQAADNCNVAMNANRDRFRKVLVDTAAYFSGGRDGR